MLRINTAVTAAGVFAGMLIATPVLANPQGPTIVRGTVSFNNPNAATLEITNSPSAILNWQSFGIGHGETTRFIQESASSAVLNRVVGGSSSEILGSLVSNGRVFLINPAGILIGRDAVVDTAGLVMATLDIDDQDFIAGRLSFTDGGDANGITNHGYIKTGPGGEIILIAPEITNAPLPGNNNSGIIETPGGELILAAGHAITITSLDHPDISMDVQAPDNSVVNLGELIANNGSVHLFAGTLQHSGAINADSLSTDAAGNVVLAASDRVYLDKGSSISASGQGEAGTIEINTSANDGRVYALGTMSADGENGGAINITADRVLAAGRASASGVVDGGDIEIAADTQVLVTAKAHLAADGEHGQGGDISVDAGDAVFSSGVMTATGQQGGNVEVLGKEITLAAATIDASGDNGGGRVRVGGGYQGGEGLRTAEQTIMNASSVIKADATTSGDGGDVVLWSDGVTHFEGAISAAGGSDGGRGGRVETSGKDGLQVSGVVDVSASDHTLAGEWLVDPKNIIFSSGSGGSSSSFSILDPNPGAGNGFGQTTSTFFENDDFSTPAKIAVFDPLDDFGGTDAGAVYLFRMSDGALLSALTGSNNNDQVGNNTLSTVNGEHFLRSTMWNNDAGAITHYDVVNGVDGIVSSGNSLVGANAGDQIGSGGVSAFGSGIAIRSPNFGGTRGAVTVTSLTNVRGTVNAGNSLVGANTGDLVGNNGFQSLFNGNFVLTSNHGGAGAVTFFDPNNAPTGFVGAANSLVGSAPGDNVGGSGVQTINGNYVVRSEDWNGMRGAITLGSLTNGISGAVSAANSLVGGSAGDQIGSGGFQFISSTQYAVLSPLWDSSALNTDAGAVTMVDVANGVFAGTATNFAGTVSAANSLVGSSMDDQVGSNGIRFFVAGSNHAVRSPDHDNSALAVSDSGALTWFQTGNALNGVVDNTNSLLGSNDNDAVGGFDNQYLFVNSGDGVLVTPSFNNNAGAVVHLDSTTPVVGNLGAANALIGSTAGDDVGGGGIEIFTNHYIVLSPDWDNGGLVDAGAFTVVDDAVGRTGAVGVANSAVGGTTGDQVGLEGVIDLFNGNVLVVSESWSATRGAVTYVDLNGGNLLGDTDFAGLVDNTNSVVGNAGNDQLASNGVIVTNGYYLIFSPFYEVGVESGAVTVVDAATGLAGIADNTNSLVGTNANDHVGGGGLFQLFNGNAVVLSQDWNGSRGAVTYLDLNGGSLIGDVDFAGNVDNTNSLVGNFANDRVGSGGVQLKFAGGNTYYTVFSPEIDDLGPAGADIGGVTFADAATGVVGDIDNTNSLIGSFANDQIGLFANHVTFSSGNIALINEQWGNDKGAVSFVDLVNGVGLTGRVDATNSVVGAVTGDFVGSAGVTELSNGVYAIQSPDWANGAMTLAGAITWGDINTGAIGVVDATNSLVGANANDQVGDFFNVNFQTGDLWYAETPNFNGGVSALTFFDTSMALPTGAVDGTNSYIGSTVGDDLGSGGIFNVFGDNGTLVVIESPDWDNVGAMDAGAFTTFFANAPGAGALNASNSLIGSTTNDRVGGGFLDFLSNGNRLIVTSSWNNDAGAVTFWDTSSTINGTVGAANSLVGANAGDLVGNWAVDETSSGHYYAASPDWNTDRGAVTFGSITNGINGTVSAANSLVGSSMGDRVGQVVTESFFTDHVIIRTPDWNAQRGAITVLNPASATKGAVSAGNSLVGSSAGDRVGDFVQQLFRTDNQGLVVARSDSWNNDSGHVTIIDLANPTTGTVSASNSLIGRAGDMVGSSGANELSNGTLVVRSPNWSDGTGGSFGAATTMLAASPVMPVTGFVSAQNSLVGSHANDQIGNGSYTTLSSGILLRSPNWFNNRGAVTFIGATNGLVGVLGANNSVVGQLADDFLGSGGITNLGGNKALIRSPLASVNGIIGAGRLDVIEGLDVQNISEDLLFDSNPGGELLVSISSVVDFLNTGATLRLQANNDILLPLNAAIVADIGTLLLEAGRSIELRSNLIINGGSVSLLANSPDADMTYRDEGDGNISLLAEQNSVRILAREVSLDAQNIFLEGGSEAGAFAGVIGLDSVNIHAHGSGLLRLAAGSAPGSSLPLSGSTALGLTMLGAPDEITTPAAFIAAGQSLTVTADDVQLHGGGSEGAFAALASFGELTVNAINLELEVGEASNTDAVVLTFGTPAVINVTNCVGCDDGTGDPFLDGNSNSGIFNVGGDIFEEPTIDAILAMLDRDEDDDEEDERDEDEAAECN